MAKTRLGPSASAVAPKHADDAKNDQLFAALSQLQTGLSDPDMKAIFRSLIEEFCPRKKDVEAARMGEPSASRPGGGRMDPEGGAKKASAVAPKLESKETAAPTNDIVKELEVEYDKAAAIGACDSKPPSLDVVNSSTHRREHARLGRRMQAAEATGSCPEMLKMWNGSRQD